MNTNVDQSTSRSRSLELEDELNRWLRVLKKRYHPEKVILFGSFASGNVKQWSDLDLIVIKETQKRFLDRIEEVLHFLHPRVGADILVYTPQEYVRLCATRQFFKEEIAKKGKIIYERRS